MKVGFIGLGNVGAKLAGTLIRNGIYTFLHDLEYSSAKNLINMGGIWQINPADLATNSDVIITCLPSPSASAAVIEGENGILKAANKENGANIFAYYVNDPERYGVVVLNDENKPIDLEEKPDTPKSNYAVTGIYMYDSDVIDVAKSIEPSTRGELEITDVNKAYLERGTLEVEFFSKGTTWLDTGTTRSLLDAANFIRVLEERQGLKIGCPEETAYRQEFIDRDQLRELAENLQKSGYGQYLLGILGDR